MRAMAAAWLQWDLKSFWDLTLGAQREVTPNHPLRFPMGPKGFIPIDPPIAASFGGTVLVRSAGGSFEA